MKTILTGILLLVIVIGFSGCAPKQAEPKQATQLLADIQPYFKIFKPASNPPYPTIVMLHGAQMVAWRDDLITTKDQLIENGFAVVFVDSYANRGLTYKNLMKGELLPPERAGDLYVTMSWLHEQSWVDKNKIGLWGHSHGAATIMDSLVLDTINEKPTSLSVLPAHYLDGVQAITLSAPWCQDKVMGIELIKAVENKWNNQIPMLSIVADKDKYTPLCKDIFNRQISNGTPIEIIELKNAQHTFANKYSTSSKQNIHYNKQHADTANAKTLEFFTKYLK